MPTDPGFWSAVLLGGAVGDALGAPIEFDSRTALERRYGPGGLTDFEVNGGRRGTITDDTQMTLFTAEALIAARENDGHVETALHHSYLRWLGTQGIHAHLPEGAPEPARTGLLWNTPDLHAVRAPGNTCISALSSGAYGTADRRINDSKGCGGVMRAAPGADFDLGVIIGAVTHGHPTGYLAAGAFAGIIGVLADGGTLHEAVDDVLVRLRAHEHGAETADALHAARKSAGAAGHIEDLGGGWIAEEALAMGVYAALRAEGDVRRGLVIAVNHSGDSDSTGAIAGNLLGAMHGRAALPADWVAEVEAREVIERVAADLAGPSAEPGLYPYG